MNMTAKSALAALAFTLASSTAFAQAPDPKGCTPQERSNQALQNDQTAGTGGVICPPDVDPAMKAPTPKTGDSSVISPPGPGNSNIQPK